ncbi:MAG: cupredoxin domain-containing protein [Chloroflexota bacterium]
MDQFAILATLFGIPAAVALLLMRRNGRRRREARLGPDGVQEMEIVVLEGYNPDVAIVREGFPVRLKFTRLENDECSSRVVFSDFKVDRRLPAYRTTAVEFLPPVRGEYLFTSEMGMYRGRLIVESASRHRWLPW